MFRFGTFFVLFLSLIVLTTAGTKSKPHSHSGLLTPYDGKHIPYEISLEQNLKLVAGEPVIISILDLIKLKLSYFLFIIRLS